MLHARMSLGNEHQRSAVQQRVGTDKASWCARFAGSRWSLALPLNPVFYALLRGDRLTWKEAISLARLSSISLASKLAEALRVSEHGFRLSSNARRSAGHV